MMPMEKPEIDSPQKAFSFAEELYLKRNINKGQTDETLRETLREKFRKTANADTIVLQLYHNAFKRTNYSTADVSKEEIAAFILFPEIPHDPNLIESVSEDISEPLMKYSDWRRLFEDALVNALHTGTSKEAIFTIAAQIIEQRQAPEDTPGVLDKIRTLWNKLHSESTQPPSHDSDQSRKDAFLFKMVGAKSLENFKNAKENIISEYESALRLQGEQPAARKILDQRYDIFLLSLEHNLRRYAYGYSAATNTVNGIMSDAVKHIQPPS